VDAIYGPGVGESRMALKAGVRAVLTAC
jgi:hypothetical protein